MKHYYIITDDFEKVEYPKSVLVDNPGYFGSILICDMEIDKHTIKEKMLVKISEDEFIQLIELFNYDKVEDPRLNQDVCYIYKGKKDLLIETYLFEKLLNTYYDSL